MNPNQGLVERLQSTVDKLIDIFGDEYQTMCVEPTTTTGTHVHVHHEYPWYWWYSPFYHPEPRQKRKDDDDDDDDQSSNGLTGAVIICGVSITGTVMFATDDYVKLWRSKISNDVDELSEAIETLENANDLMNTITKCQKWIECYEQRTKPMFWSKVGLISSGIAFGVGTFMSKSDIQRAAVGTAVVSTCYALWNYFTKSDIKAKESRYFNDAVLSINNAKDALANSSYSHPPIFNQTNAYPSAPNLYDFKQ